MFWSFAAGFYSKDVAKKLWRSIILEMFKSPLSKKGFSLVEILIVVMIIGILSVAAITTYLRSTDNFRFLANLKNVISLVRNARSNAITNKEIVLIASGGQTTSMVPNAYGVAILAPAANTTIMNLYLFADSGPQNFVFEQNADQIIQGFSFDVSSISLLGFDSSLNTPLAMPLVFFYKTGSGEFTAMENGTQLISKSAHKFFALQHCKAPCSPPNSTNPSTLEKYIVIFQVSGLPEEFDNVRGL